MKRKSFDYFNDFCWQKKFSTIKKVIINNTKKNMQPS